MAARQKILILDDEHDILEIYQEILARLPSQPEIHTADTGARAIALLESEPFNLLLVDLRMPTMDGFQVLAIVRRKFPDAARGGDDGGGGRAIPRPRLRHGHRSLHGEAEDRERDHQLRRLHRVDAREGGRRRLPRGAEQDARRYHPARVPDAELGHSENLERRSAKAASGFRKARSSTPRPASCWARRRSSKCCSWRAGSFEILPNDVPRPRTIFSSYENLLMETAQTIDEAKAEDLAADGSQLAGRVFALQGSAVRRRRGIGGQDEV